jgi:hypothetical protein
VPRAAAIAVAALVAGAAVVAIELASDHRDARVVWAVFAPAVIWSFVGTGLYAWRARPESRVGAADGAAGFAWVLFTLDAGQRGLALHDRARHRRPVGRRFLHLGWASPRAGS